MEMNANGWRDCPKCGNAFWQDNDDTTILCCDYKLILTPMGKIAWVKKLTQTVECPEHNGAFDCTPFCNVCNGEQEFEKKVMV